MALVAVLSASLVGGAVGHGFIISPVARQQGASSFEVAGTGCAYNSCAWFTNSVAIKGKPTNCDASMATTGNVDPCKGSWSNTKPWRAPGTAPSTSPCGAKGGTHGTALKPAKRSIWPRGGTVEVAHAITANHGGGYAYRLCPADAALTEGCFASNHLAFAEDTTTVRFINGSTLQIPSLTFTTPEGRQWKKNPIPEDPAKDNYPAPFPGGEGSSWPFSLVDRVLLPETLPAGDYLISWRWDCEATPQVWANCGDVTIVDGPIPPPTTPAPAPPAPAPTPAPPAPTTTLPPPTPAPTPTPPAPTPPAPAPTPPPYVPKHPTCCWSAWGDRDTCAGYPGGNGAKCNTNWGKKCGSDGDCKVHIVV